jgi:hypothetical protein
MLRSLIFAATLCMPLVSFAEQCTFSREEISGDTRICFYSCLRGEQVISMSKYGGVCPLMHDFSATRPIENLSNHSQNLRNIGLAYSSLTELTTYQVLINIGGTHD